MLVAAFCLLWASAFSVAKLAVADCPPLLVLTARFLLAAAVMLGGATIFRAPFKLSRRDVLIFAVLGIANQAAYLGLSYVGIRSISSGLAALVISASPVLTAALAAVFLNERMTWRKLAGLLLGIGGVAFVVEHRLAGGVEHSVGIVFTIAALISLTAGTILFKKLAPAGGLWIGNGVQSLSAGLVTLRFAFTLESVGDIVPSLAPHSVCRLPGAFRFDIRKYSLVPLAQSVERDRREFLSLHDASPWHAVRVASAWRACCAQ